MADDRIRVSDAARLEATAVSDAVSAFGDHLYELLGDRVVTALAGTEHVHSRALIAPEREGDADLVGMITGSSAGGNESTTRVVVPVTIRVTVGAAARLTSAELAGHMAAAKAAAARTCTPEMMGAIRGLLRSYWGEGVEPDGEDRDADELETCMRALAAVAGVVVPKWAELPPSRCYDCGAEFYTTAPQRLPRRCPACRRSPPPAALEDV